MQRQQGSPSDTTRDDLSYQVKQIVFKGRKTPILLQDVNGPCPILAIANVLLLRNQLKLPAGVGEVSEARLVQLVAGHLLDANSLDGREGSMSEEYAANLQQNVADAIALLPKLTTGIDVNLRFHDIRGFEFTKEVAVFDLLDIGLIHGWLCDPQDEATCCAVGQRSYNELVMQLVTTLGGAATPMRGPTPTGSFKGAAAAAAVEACRGQQQQQQPDPALMLPHGEGQAADAAGSAAGEGAGAGPISAEMLTAALQSSLQAVGGEQQLAGAAGVQQAASPVAAACASPSVGPSPGAGLSPSAAVSPGHISDRSSRRSSGPLPSLIDEMMSGTVQDAFCTPTAKARSWPQLETSPAEPPQQQQQQQARGQEQQPHDMPSNAGEGEGSGGHSDAVAVPIGAAGVPGPLARQQEGDQGEWVAVVLRCPRPDQEEQQGGWAPVQVELVFQPPQQQLLPSPQEQRPQEAPTTPAGTALGSSGSGPSGALPAAAGGGGEASAPPDEGAVHDALLIQQFLEGSPSQLTWHGLQSLHEGLRDNELAVFFRNNHFNTMHRREDGLYILVTDQGYQYESDVVWEHLATVDGDTQFVDASFHPFMPHAHGPGGAAAMAQPSHEAGQAQAAEFEQGASAGPSGNHEDADFALALAMQQEEHDRLDREAQQAQQAERARQQQQQQHVGAGQAGRQQQQQQPQRAGGVGAARPAQQASGRPGGGGSKKKFSEKVKEECSIM